MPTNVVVLCLQVVNAIKDVSVKGPSGSHYHFVVDHVHSDYNPDKSDKVMWCMHKDTSGNWAYETKCIMDR